MNRRAWVARGGRLVAWAAASVLASCSPARPGAARSPVAFVNADGAVVGEPALLARAPWTVLVFFSSTCHCVAAHQPRLRALEARFKERGVQFFWVDSEIGATPERDSVEARRRGLTFPVLQDPGARAARRFDARFASDSVILDRAGAVRYHGGVDSDRTHLRDDAEPYLGNALEDLLAGREPRSHDGPALGCALQTW